jgi:hypothetical protein
MILRRLAKHIKDLEYRGWNIGEYWGHSDPDIYIFC